MGVIYPRGTGYTASVSAQTDVQGWSSDAYVYGESRRIGEIYYGASSIYPASTNGVNTGGSYSIADAVGITCPAGTQIGAINFTCGKLTLTYRDSIKSGYWNNFEIALAESYANVSTNWNDANVVASITNVAIHPEDNNTQDTWGHSYVNIIPLLQDCTLPFLSNKSFYILIRNPSINQQLRFERISKNRDNGRDQTITVEGTLKKPSVSITTPTDGGKYWGTSLQTAGSVNKNFVGSGKFAYSQDNANWSSNTTTWPNLTSLCTAASTGTTCYFYAKAAYNSGFKVGTTTQTYGNTAGRTFYMYGTKPSITIGTITVGTTTASVPFTCNYANKTTESYECSADGVHWYGTGNPSPFSGLSVGTTYTAYIRTKIKSGFPEAGSYIQGTKQFTTSSYTACTAPTVTISYIGNGILRVSWSGASGGTNNAITGYDVGIVTSKTAPSSPTNDTASPCSFTPGNTTAYYGAVRTKGAAGASYYSNWAYSSSTAKCPYASHPTVAVGDVITKVQMDKLKTWKNQGTAVTVGNTITQAVGDTYRSTTAGAEITAAWYNNA